MKKQIGVFIGCDPAFRKNGMSIFINDIQKKEYYTIIFKTLRDFQKWIDGLKDEKPPEMAVVGVENSGNGIVYEQMYKNFLKACGAKDSRQMRDKYAISVGKNMAATQYVLELFKSKYKPRRVIDITPSEKGKKLSQHELKMFYDIELKDSEQDERDAAVICEKARNKFLFKQKIISK